MQEEERLNLISVLGIDVSPQQADGWISEDDESDTKTGAKAEGSSVTHEEEEVYENTGHGYGTKR